MKKTILGIGLGVLLPGLVLAATVSYKSRNGDTISKVAGKVSMTPAEFVAKYPNAKLASGQTFSNTTTDPVTPPVGSEIKFTAYITGWGYPDNDPANSDTTYNSGIEGHAHGTGTYEDPISMAVGYVGEKSDYPYGTKFYIANLKAYFEVVDTCASCHKGQGGLVWLDTWHGGKGESKGAVIACEEKHTGNYLVIQNPASTYPVIVGALFQNGVCR